MEAASLAIGLVTIIGVFKDVIDLIDLIASAKDLDRDYVILETRLDIEKALLLDWASRMGLLSLGSYDKQLDNPDKTAVISRILSTISQLLGDADKLENRFGMRKGMKEEDGDWPYRPRGIQISLDAMARFRGEFDLLTVNAPPDKRPRSSIRNRIVWVCQDKKKFRSLVEELSYLVASLRNLVPPPVLLPDDERRIRPLMTLMTMEDMHNRFDIESLRLVLAASEGHEKATISEFASTALTEKYKDRILRQVWFRTMNERRNNLPKAHEKTLSWSLVPPGDGGEWDDLSQWLRSGSGVYWISGKAGSGKSTLMKYLLHTPGTKNLLSYWDSFCTVGSFFFWYAGTSEQQSLRGLMRTILHQLLSHPYYRSLIPEMLPEMWNEVHLNEKELKDPSDGDLMLAFERFSQRKMHVPPQEAKFCFLIDGLDEFSGHIRDGIEFIQNLARDRNVKIIVSSRPIPPCQTAFRSLPSLRLQELNRADIQEYVTSAVANHERMKIMMEQNPQTANGIMDELAGKSCGVFLWVILACRSILNGLEEGDTVMELQKRVAEFPEELREMFRLMLRKVPDRYAAEQGRLLGLCQAQKEDDGASLQLFSLALLHSVKIDEYLRDPNLIGLFKRREMCQEVAERIRSRCGGLLELSHDSVHGSVDDEGSVCFCDGIPTAMKQGQMHDYWIDAKIEFMHRTVFEYINNLDESDREAVTVDKSSAIYSALSMCELFMAVGLLHSSLLDAPLPDSHFIKAFLWGARAEMENPSERSNVFWKMAPFLDHLGEVCPLSLNRSWVLAELLDNRRRYQHNTSHQIFQLALIFIAVNYVREHRDTAMHPRITRCSLPGLLTRCFDRNDYTASYAPEPLQLLVADTFMNLPEVTNAWLEWQDGVTMLIPVCSAATEEYIAAVTRLLHFTKPATADLVGISNMIRSRRLQTRSNKEVDAIWESLEAELLPDSGTRPPPPTYEPSCLLCQSADDCSCRRSGLMSNTIGGRKRRFYSAAGREGEEPSRAKRRG